jgi:hypothetical protein
MFVAKHCNVRQVFYCQEFIICLVLCLVTIMFSLVNELIGSTMEDMFCTMDLLASVFITFVIYLMCICFWIVILLHGCC